MPKPSSTMTSTKNGSTRTGMPKKRKCGFRPMAPVIMATRLRVGGHSPTAGPQDRGDALHLGRVRALAVGSAAMSERPVIDADHLPTGEDKARAVRAMFDAIAPRYDLVNRIMTFRMDVGWRRRTVRDLRLGPGS